MRIFLALVLSILPASAFSNAKIAGNGGDVIACRDGSGGFRSVEIFDYYEARALRGISVSLPAGKGPEDIARKALVWLKGSDPERLERYQGFVESFLAQTVFVDGVLTDIPDSNHLVVPRGCGIEQLVVRAGVRFPGDRAFVVSRELWNGMDDFQRAGALLHEAFYDEALERGAADSMATRYFHSMVVSGTLARMSDKSYLAVMDSISPYFPLFNLGGMTIPLYSRVGWEEWLREHLLFFSKNDRLLAAVGSTQVAMTIPEFEYPAHRSPWLKIPPLSSGERGAKEVGFISTPAGTEISWKGLFGKLAITLHQQELELSHGSDLVLRPGSVTAVLAAHSCYQQPNGMNYCGQSITVSSLGIVEHPAQ